MSWYLAPALKTFRAQIDTKFPNRSKVMDGTVGDLAHSSRKSDHNPDSDQSVNAVDITHDPKNGVDGNVLALQLSRLASALGRASRIEYIIWAGRIWSQNKPAWTVYTGSNGHYKHVHLSIVHTAGERDISLWPLPLLGGVIVANIGGKPVTSGNPDQPTLRSGSKGSAVKFWQQLVGVTQTSTFDPVTAVATRTWQEDNGLKSDGVVGPATWGLALQKLTAYVNAGKAKKLDAKEYPILKQGSKGERVEFWQSLVGAKKDGDFGSKTAEATKAFQTDNHLRATGVVDNLTWVVALELFGRFMEGIKKAKAAEDRLNARAKAAGYTAAAYPNLREGSEGKAVELWQDFVGAKKDGDYGKETLLLTMDWKKKNKLPFNGTVDKAAWVTALELLKAWIQGSK